VTFLEWLFMSLFVALYLMCLFTVCLFLLPQGYVVLGIFGIFLPLLWLIGAILPAKRGSAYEADQAMRYQGQMGGMTR
jgi:hypothetical protein